MIQAGLAGPVKIGFTDGNPQFRCHNLQSSHYDELYIIRTIKGCRAHERWLHAYYHPFKLRAEWFSFQKDMLSVVPGMLQPFYSRTKTITDKMAEWHDIIVKDILESHTKPNGRTTNVTN